MGKGGTLESLPSLSRELEPMMPFCLHAGWAGLWAVALATPAGSGAHISVGLETRRRL